MSKRRMALSALGALSVALSTLVPLPLEHSAAASAVQEAERTQEAEGSAAATPATLFSEGFEDLPSGTGETLERYSGGRYTTGVAAQWLDPAQCNGLVLRDGADLLGAGCTPHNQQLLYDSANALGRLQNLDSNAALGSATAQGLSTGQDVAVIFDSGEITPIATTTAARAEARFLQASMAAADAHGCSKNMAQYDFLLRGRDSSPTEIASGMTVCDYSAGAKNETVAAILPRSDQSGQDGAEGQWSALWGGGTFSLVIENHPVSTDADGDDGAIDDIRVDDVTPTVSLGADATPVKAGETAQLTVTVANTPDSRDRLEGKEDWGFTLNLPTGLELAAEPEASATYAASAAAGKETTETECPAAIRQGDDGAGNSVQVSDGELAPGQSSCTVTIPVRQTAGYDPGRTVQPTLTSDSLTGLDGIDRALPGRTEQMLTFTDAVAPVVPTLQPSDGTAVSGVSEAGATVTVAPSASTCTGEGVDTAALTTATVGADGTFTVPLPRRQPDGSSLFVSVADAAGNRSACTQLTVLADPPPAPDVFGVADGVATGTALPGTTVVVTDARGRTLVQAPVDENGLFRLRVAAPVGSEVALFSRDAAGNRSEPVTVRVAPAAAPAPNRPIAAHPLARDESSAPMSARALPRTGLAGTGWPAAIALLLLTGLALVALARVGGRR